MITVGGHWSLSEGDKFYKYGIQMRRVCDMFAEWVNSPDGCGTPAVYTSALLSRLLLYTCHMILYTEDMVESTLAHAAGMRCGLCGSTTARQSST